MDLNLRIIELEDKIWKLQNGPIIRVENIMIELDKTINGELLNEITQSHNSRDEMRIENDLMKNEYNQLKSTFVKNFNDKSNNFNQIKGLQEKKFND